MSTLHTALKGLQLEVSQLLQGDTQGLSKLQQALDSTRDRLKASSSCGGLVWCGGAHSRGPSSYPTHPPGNWQAEVAKGRLLEEQVSYLDTLSCEQVRGRRGSRYCSSLMSSPEVKQVEMIERLQDQLEARVDAAREAEQLLEETGLMARVAELIRTAPGAATAEQAPVSWKADSVLAPLRRPIPWMMPISMQDLALVPSVLPLLQADLAARVYEGRMALLGQEISNLRCEAPSARFPLAG